MDAAGVEPRLSSWWYAASVCTHHKIWIDTRGSLEEPQEAWSQGSAIPGVALPKPAPLPIRLTQQAITGNSPLVKVGYVLQWVHMSSTVSTVASSYA
jgi:hypothetical protein